MQASPNVRLGRDKKIVALEEFLIKYLIVMKTPGYNETLYALTNQYNENILFSSSFFPHALNVGVTRIF